MIVIVVLGVLASIALPKLGSTQDKAKLAAVKSDVRNTETAEEAYFSDNGRYGNLAQLQGEGFTMSAGTTMRITANKRGYTVRASNRSIGSSIKGCSVQVGGGTPMTMDGVIGCP
jgi:type II secretory pathway pseudopilin PulG